MKSFGEALRDLRESRKLPLRKIAAFLDIDTSVMSKIERGERIASKAQVMKLAEYFNVEEEILVKDYYGEQIARLVYTEKDIGAILETAEKKVVYLREINNVQGRLTFNEE